MLAASERHAPVSLRLRGNLQYCSIRLPGFFAEGEVETETGIIVDEHMRTSVPGLFAAGDAAQAIDPLSGRHHLVALWASARRQGRTAGSNMAGYARRGSGLCRLQHPEGLATGFSPVPGP